MNLKLIFLPMMLLACGGGDEPHVVLEMGCEQCGKGENVQEGCDQCMAMGDNALALTRPDINQARTMFNKGCTVHHAPSCMRLAVMVRDGRGGPPDLKRSTDLFRIACEKGPIQEACTEWGLSQFDGVGTKKNQEAAVLTFEAACDHETDPQPKSCAALGLAYIAGDGVERKDEDKGLELLKQSCASDYASGCVQTGTAFLTRNRGSRKENLEIAAEAYERACKLDPRHGCFELAEMHENKKAIDYSFEKAALFYQKTCNIDPTRGCFEAAELMSSGKVDARDGEIASLYNIACEHGHEAACSKRALDYDE